MLSISSFQPYPIFHQCSASIPPENISEHRVFCCFQGVWKRNMGWKCVNECILTIYLCLKHYFQEHSMLSLKKNISIRSQWCYCWMSLFFSFFVSDPLKIPCTSMLLCELYWYSLSICLFLALLKVLAIKFGCLLFLKNVIDRHGRTRALMEPDVRVPSCLEKI